MDLIERLLPNQSFNKSIVRRKQIKYVTDTFDLSAENKKIFYASEDWKKLKKYIYSKYENICFCCGSFNELQVDHIIPITKSPSRSLNHNNLQILCKTCNQIKSNKSNARFNPIIKPVKVSMKSIIGIRYKWRSYFPHKNI